MCKLVEAKKDHLSKLDGLDDPETNCIAGVLVKLLLDIVKWGGDDPSEDPFSAFPAETQGRELLKEIANKRGWDWKNKEGAAENSFVGLDDWYLQLKEKHGIGELFELLAALIRENATSVDAMSRKYGQNFDECILSILTNILDWDSEFIDEEGIRSMEDPAIFAFSFGTGDKIGPALAMPTKVGPGCETPGKTNEGLADEIKNILAVRPMPVFAQWEIADALLQGAQGHPRAESFFAWHFGDGAEGGVPEKAGEWYGRIEEYAGPDGTSAKIYKSLPIWPLA